MNHPRFVLLILVLQFVICSVGNSQQQLATESKLGLSHTLTFNGVTEDLELTDEQGERLFGLWTEVQTRLEWAFQNYKANYSPRFSPEKVKELREELATRIEAIRESELDRLNDVLLPHQLKRLKQIRFQILKRNSDGLRAMVTELSLSRDQVQQIKKVKTNLTASINELRQYAQQEQLTPNELAEELDAIRADSESQLLEVLSPSQRKKLEELEGEKFELQTGPPKQEN